MGGTDGMNYVTHLAFTSHTGGIGNTSVCVYLMTRRLCLCKREY